MDLAYRVEYVREAGTRNICNKCNGALFKGDLKIAVMIQVRSVDNLSRSGE